MEIFQSSPLVATTQGLWDAEGLWEGGRVASDLYRGVDSNIWAIFSDQEQVVNLDSGELLQIPGLTGPIAEKSEGLGMWVLAGDELVVATAEGVLTRFLVEGVVDIQAAGKFELALLHGDGRVSSFFDEEQLVDGVPLSFVMASFVERPKSPAEDEPCTGADSNVTAHVEMAATNLRFLKDLPAPVALGVTPHLGRRARQCGVEDRLSGILQTESFEVGVLIHQAVESTCAEDSTCYANFLSANAAIVNSYGGGLAWASGMASHTEDGADWVQGLVDSGVADRFLFFGLSVLAQVKHETDPRSKEAFPLEAGDRTRPWTISSAAKSGVHAPGGELALYPGNNRAAFNLGSCPNLLVRECGSLSQGGGEVVDLEDIEVLDLLVHRALAERDRDLPSAWSFHLPDIGLYDYTEGCEVDEHRWVGEDCEAGRLQTWLLDVHQRFATTGRISWAAPGAVPLP
jgi:hypothetical protein